MLTSVYACQSVLWDSFPGSETEFHARQAHEDLQGAQQFGIVFFVCAVVAQLVEHHLAKVDVASSSLVNRSTKPLKVLSLGGFCFGCTSAVPYLTRLIDAYSRL